MERPRIPRGPVSHAFKIGAIAAAVRFLLICLHFLHTAVHVSCKKRHISSLLTQFMYHIPGRIYVSHMSLLLIFSAARSSRPCAVHCLISCTGTSYLSSCMSYFTASTYKCSCSFRIDPGYNIFFLDLHAYCISCTTLCPYNWKFGPIIETNQTLNEIGSWQQCECELWMNKWMWLWFSVCIV